MGLPNSTLWQLRFSPKEGPNSVRLRPINILPATLKG
jgi:hypothetical protein